MSDDQPRRPTFSTSMPIGYTSKGQQDGVFFDTHTAIFNNGTPGTLVTGSPGSGKTFFLLTITMINVLLGKTCIVIDPKADFLSLKNLEDEIGTFNLWNLGQNDQNGVIDPFYMVDNPSEKLDLALNVISLFLGGITNDEQTALAPIIKDVVKEPDASLGRVVDELRGSEKQIARNMGHRLDIIRTLPLSKLAFANNAKKNRQTVDISKGLTIITMLGVDLPTNAEDARNTNNGRMVSGILYLLLNFIKRVLKDDDSPNPKLLIIDEAWQFVSSKEGASIVKEVALLGRSKNLALVLASQSQTHLDKLDIENTISSRFAFRSTKDEGRRIVANMNLPANEGYENILVNLDNGECLYMDWLGRYSIVKIIKQSQEWADAFDTNPLARLKKKEKEEKEKRKKQEQSG